MGNLQNPDAESIAWYKFCFSRLTGDEASPGNAGLMDQVLALQWIKNNIAGMILGILETIKPE